MLRWTFGVLYVGLASIFLVFIDFVFIFISACFSVVMGVGGVGIGDRHNDSIVG